MQTELDDSQGQAVGSRIRLSGKVLGLELSVEEIVTERVPPNRKAWETIGLPRLLVIGHYRMGFELVPEDNGSVIRVYIDYALPEDALGRWFGFLLARYYARFCTQRMVTDAETLCRRESVKAGHFSMMPQLNRRIYGSRTLSK